MESYWLTPLRRLRSLLGGPVWEEFASSGLEMLVVVVVGLFTCMGLIFVCWTSISEFREAVIRTGLFSP